MKGHRKFLCLSHIVLLIVSVLALIPFWLLILASLTEEEYAVTHGYSLLPSHLDLAGYRYLLTRVELFGRGYLITIVVTVIGVILCMVVTTMLGYMLSRPNLPWKGFFNFYVVFTMLFNGGLVATYVNYVQTFHIKNTIWALVIPNLVTNAFQIIMVKNYFRSNIPEELLESARIDGSGEFNTFFRIALPLSKPIIATVALLVGVTYWNDWQNGLYYLDDQNLYGIQNILNAINTNSQYLMKGGGSAALPRETARMAAAVVGMLPMLAAYPFFQSYFVKGITAGAVKG